MLYFESCNRKQRCIVQNIIWALVADEQVRRSCGTHSTSPSTSYSWTETLYGHLFSLCGTRCLCSPHARESRAHLDLVGQEKTWSKLCYFSYFLRGPRSRVVSPPTERRLSRDCGWRSGKMLLLLGRQRSLCSNTTVQNSRTWSGSFEEPKTGTRRACANTRGAATTLTATSRRRPATPRRRGAGTAAPRGSSTRSSRSPTAPTGPTPSCCWRSCCSRRASSAISRSCVSCGTTCTWKARGTAC